MSWVKESILILVKAAPNWSTKYKTYEVCTAGISEAEGWRRLYPFHEMNMVKKEIRLWDIIQVETTKPTDDPRQESRKIKSGSIKVVGHVESRKEKREIIGKIAEPSLDIPMSEKRSLALIKPQIESFKIRKEEPEPIQLTLEGKSFRKHPYGDVGLYYRWSCPKPCRYCKDKPHNTRCFDWGANYLYKKYQGGKEAKSKVTNKLLYEMKYDNDTWFALGTTRKRPWKRWMIIGLLWMKKKESSKLSTKPLSEFT